MNQELYWLWLANLKGIGAAKTRALLTAFDTPEKIFRATQGEIEEALEEYKAFKEEDVENLLTSRDEVKIERYAKRLNERGIYFVSMDHPEYPRNLKHLYDPPNLLYYRGLLPAQESIKLAMVGARKCSSYGKYIAESFGKALAEHGIVIVSGMARGIDTASHQGALKGRGETMAILGSGVNICYPSENIKLMNQIIEHGCVMSEYPVNAAPIAANFPLRNRIISGLSDGVLIIEAAKESGSLITADSALEQGKEVFAVPGRILDASYEGTNGLIKMGAKPVFSVEDILEEFHLEKKAQPAKEVQLDLDEQNVLIHIGHDPVAVDQLAEKTGMRIGDLQFLLIKLELKGVVLQMPNMSYVRQG